MSRLSLDSCVRINANSQANKCSTAKNSPLSPSVELFQSASFSFLRMSIRYCPYAIFYLTHWNKLGIVCHYLEPFLLSFNSACRTDKPLGRRKTHCGNFLKPGRRFWLANTHHPGREGLNNSPGSLIRCVKAEHKVWASRRQLIDPIQI